MNGRVYSTAYDRFLSPDPLIQDPHYSQSYNRYAYVWNNPLSNVDPTGYRCHGISGSGYSGVSCSAPAYDPYTDQNYLDGTRIDIDYHQPNYHFRQDPYLDQNGPGNFDRLGGGAAPCLGCFPDLGDVLYEGYKDARDALQQWAEEHKDNKEDSKEQGEEALDASAPEPPVPGAEPTGEGKRSLTEWEVSGSYEDAYEEAEKQASSGLKDYGNGRAVGVREDGSRIIVRPGGGNKFKGPGSNATIEIQPPGGGRPTDKVRYR